MAKKTKKVKLLEPNKASRVEVYEMAVVMPPVLPDDVNDRIVPKISELVESKDGSLEIKEDWGKRHLAYEINGNEEGYYIFFKLTLPASELAELTQELNRMSSDILRFLIIREDNL